jgi:hypothetical protein
MISALSKGFAIDQLTSTSVRLELMFQQKIVAVGTGFLWKEGSSTSLVTAWHNVTGTHPETGKALSPTGVRPDAFRAHFVPTNMKQPVVSVGELYGTDGNALFRTHLTYGKLVDVVAISIDPPLSTTSLCCPINLLPEEPIHLQIGGNAFVIGFPKGLSASGLPIWKSGTLASEPALVEASKAKTSYLLDAATREGMSGAPAILLADGSYQDQQGNFIMGAGRVHRFLGLYSGRVSSSDQMEAQLGMIWPARLVREVVIQGIPDDFTLHG